VSWLCSSTGSPNLSVATLAQQSSPVAGHGGVLSLACLALLPADPAPGVVCRRLVRHVDVGNLARAIATVRSRRVQGQVQCTATR